MKANADIPEPTLIGYFAKLTMKRPDWLKAPQVEEIGSASTCMSRADWDWINPNSEVEPRKGAKNTKEPS